MSRDSAWGEWVGQGAPMPDDESDVMQSMVPREDYEALKTEVERRKEGFRELLRDAEALQIQVTEAPKREQRLCAVLHRLLGVQALGGVGSQDWADAEAEARDVLGEVGNE